MAGLSISAAGLQTLVEQYAITQEGQKAMSDTIVEHVNTGRTFANGSAPISQARMEKAASAMISILRSALPDSIKSVGAHIGRDIPKQAVDGDFVVKIKFDEDALRRESLLKEIEPGHVDSGERTGDGIDNIVQLLNNGTTKGAKAYAYGYWDRSGANDDGSSGAGDYAYVRSRRNRDPMYFMQHAIMVFNRTYGKMYHAEAELSSIYEPSGSDDDDFEYEE